MSDDKDCRSSRRRRRRCYTAVVVAVAFVTCGDAEQSATTSERRGAPWRLITSEMPSAAEDRIRPRRGASLVYFVSYRYVGLDTK